MKSMALKRFRESSIATPDFSDRRIALVDASVQQAGHRTWEGQIFFFGGHGCGGGQGERVIFLCVVVRHAEPAIALHG
jgi:hypothetical protein